MSGFKEGWTRFGKSQEHGDAAPELKALVQKVYQLVVDDPTDLSALKDALVRLLQFLASPAGRTDANCWATDLFFCVDDHWERRWNHLPESFAEVLDDIGGALHDTIGCLEVAQNFDSTPEQLLERVQVIEVK